MRRNNIKIFRLVFFLKAEDFLWLYALKYHN